MSGYSGYNNSTGWEENNSPYDTEEPSEEDNLDHCRLHVKNLPKGLNQQGLEMAFSKYGTLTECFVSTDPKKHYGLVRFETPGEAKQAMMKLNHTEPLRLNISIAYKMKKKMDTQDNARRSNYNSNNNNNRRTVNNGHVGTDRDRSYSSRYSTQEMAQGDISISHINDLMDHAEEEDEDVELTLQKLRKMLYRQKLNTSKTAAAPTGLGTRCVLPGGRIVVNNDSKANNLDSSGDYDGNYAACGGDTPVNVPALQHERSDACVACGAAASAYCARCEVTPYCGPLCQRRDWARRHSQLCHNLARTQVPPLKVDEPPIAALRRPRSDVSADNDRKKLQPASDNRAPKEQSTRTMRVPQDVRPVHENNRGNNDRRGNQDGRGNQGYNRNQDGGQGYNRKEDGGQGYNRKEDGGQGYNRNQDGNQGFNRNQDGGNQGYNRNQDGGNQGYNRNQDGGQGYNRNQDGGNQGYNRNQDGNQGYNRNQDGGQGYNRNRQGMNQRPQGRQAYPRNDDADETWDNKKPDAPATPKVTGYPKAAEPEAKPKTPEVQPKTPEVQPKAVASTSKLPEAAKVESPKMMIKPALTAAATTPTKRVKAAPVVEQKPLVPEKSVIEQTELGETLICSVENKASDCAASGGVICLLMNERFQEGYMKLCEDYLVACEEDAEEFKPSPGDTFSICDPADGGWYRARLLTPASCALLDAGRLLAVSPAARCRRLARAFRDQPEYCAALDAQIEVGANIQLIVTSISPNGDRLVSIVRVETSEKIGDGVARRWLPAVEYPATPAAAVEQPPAIPTVPRPPLKNNSSVVVIDVSESRLIVRDADLAVARHCDMIEQDVAIYGSTATPLTEPPSKGDVIIARYTDNIHYRALCKRTSVKQNKYLLEYIEYGNTEITTLDKLYPCPPQYSLDARPCLTSEATVHGLDLAMSDAARAYLDTVKEQQMIAKLTIPSGEPTAPSGSPVVLTLTKNNESVNRKVQEMSTPEWKKIEESGGDILDTSILMLSDLQYAPLPLTGGKLQITDGSTLPVGAVSGFPVAASETVAAVLGPLTDRITEYANSEIGSKPYLPRTEELCIAKCEPYTQWFRAVLCELTNGPGSETAEVLYLDYGNLSRVPTSSLRKCLRDFIELPAVAVQAYIADFPKDPTPAQLEKAKAFLSLTSDGEGQLEYTRAEMQDPGSYTVYAPALIQAMM